MQIELNDMDKGRNSYKVYSYMWNDASKIPGNICKTYSIKRGDNSDNSYSFKIPGLSSKYLTTAKELSKVEKETIAEQLISNFRIDDEEKDDFKSKLIAACSGSGGEGAKITTLHSSSLCAFLFFYKVSDTHPLNIDINGNNIAFFKVLFEYQNTVIEGRNPSNVDIVLIGQDNKNEDIILFLESKFSEYLTPRQANVALEYIKQYPNIYNPKEPSFLDAIGFEFKKNKKDGSLIHQLEREGKIEKVYKIGPKHGSAYSEGIKQMISHYLGVDNFINGKPFDRRPLPNGAKVYLGEIIFDFSFKDAEDCLSKYRAVYEKLAKELNKLNKGIHVLEKPLNYSLFKKKDFINPTIRKFYFGEERQKKGLI